MKRTVGYRLQAAGVAFGDCQPDETMLVVHKLRYVPVYTLV
jgi:hypothetical protein